MLGSDNVAGIIRVFLEITCLEVHMASRWRLDLTTGKWLSPADVSGEARGARLINDGRGLKRP